MTLRARVAKGINQKEVADHSPGPGPGFGALLTLWVLRTELSIYAFVGIIMLVMTTMSALMGTLPIAIGWGGGVGPVRTPH